MLKRKRSPSVTFRVVGNLAFHDVGKVLHRLVSMPAENCFHKKR